MRIDELDEFQGVTPQLVADWLLANGWTQTKPRWWERGEDGFLFDSETFDQMWFWTHALAAIYTAGNIQALLSKINPRMRKGMPSDAALAEHDEWIVCTPFGATFIAEISYGGSDDGFSIMMPPINDHCDAEFIAEKHWPECLFWPCDEHGNKVRWPTDAEGKML